MGLVRLSFIYVLATSLPSSFPRVPWISSGKPLSFILSHVGSGRIKPTPDWTMPSDYPIFFGCCNWFCEGPLNQSGPKRPEETFAGVSGKEKCNTRSEILQKKTFLPSGGEHEDVKM